MGTGNEQTPQRSRPPGEKASGAKAPSAKAPSAKAPTGSGFDRRSFLKRGGVAAAAASLVAAVPGGTALFGALGAEAPEVAPAGEGAAASEAEAASMSDAVVAHVKNLSTGEISLYSGTREVVVRNPSLASQLFRATR